MPDAPHIPTISVKKNDGTIVKMTLDEFRVYKAQMKNPGSDSSTQKISYDAPQGKPLAANVVVKPEVPSVNLPMVEESQEVANFTPANIGVSSEKKVSPAVEEKPVPPKPVFKKMSPPPVQAPPPLSKEDFVSLLEEESQSQHQSVSSVNDQITEEIMKKITFAFDKNVEARLQSLILSRVKEIRSDAQVKEYAMLSLNEGGLGFDLQKTQILMQALQDGLQKKPQTTPNLSAKMRLDPISSVLPPSSKKPVDVSPEKVPAKKPDAQKILSSLIVEDNVQAQFLAKANTQSVAKVSMHDVVNPSRSVGPVDEMQSFTVVDFRRLGKNAEESANALMQKFTVLKNDTYLLFLSGRTAWFKSPLYQMYLSFLEQSLKMNKPLSSVLGSGEKDSLTLEEIQQVSRVSQSLNF